MRTHINRLADLDAVPLPHLEPVPAQVPRHLSEELGGLEESYRLRPPFGWGALVLGTAFTILSLGVVASGIINQHVGHIFLGTITSLVTGFVAVSALLYLSNPGNLPATLWRCRDGIIWARGNRVGHFRWDDGCHIVGYPADERLVTGPVNSPMPTPDSYCFTIVSPAGEAFEVDPSFCFVGKQGWAFFERTLWAIRESMAPSAYRAWRQGERLDFAAFELAGDELLTPDERIPLRDVLGVTCSEGSVEVYLRDGGCLLAAVTDVSHLPVFLALLGEITQGNG